MANAIESQREMLQDVCKLVNSKNIFFIPLVPAESFVFSSYLRIDLLITLRNLGGIFHLTY